jgi:hypothetical protein
MDHLLQKVLAGHLETTFDRQLQQFQKKELLRRFWSKDATIWPADHSGQALIQTSLAWLDFPETLEPLFRALPVAAEHSLEDGLLDWVFLALGNSSLAARSLLPFLALPPDRRFFVLDSSHPSAIRRLQNAINLLHTGFILANKSGDRLEDQALFLYFQHALQLVHSPDVNRHFAAQTEANSFLDSMGRGYAFRASFHDPPHTPSPYCSLLHFGALMMALAILNADQALSSARTMRQACSADSPSNPALQLGAFLASAALSPCRYLVFLSTPSLIPYSYRLGNLVGGSLSGEEANLIPVCGDVPRHTESFQNNAVFVFLSFEAERTPELEKKIESFRVANIPFVDIPISDIAALLPETFKWEIATALACANVGLNPFGGPDVRYPRRAAMELLDSLSSTPSALTRTPRLQESGLQLFAEGRTRAEISTFSLIESLRSFFRLKELEGPLVLLIYLDRTPVVESALQKIRERLTIHLGIPVLLSYGPRGLDQYPNLFGTTVSDALFIVLTSDYPIDIPVPGADYSFAQLHTALCLGEFEYLNHSDRWSVRINLTGNLAESLTNLEHAFDTALSHSL